MGRGPKATISFTYCMARAELKLGGGPRSALTIDASATTGAGADAATSFGAAASFVEEQPDKANAKDTDNATAMDRLGPLPRFRRSFNVIEIFSPRAPSAVLDAPGKRSRCLPDTARPWARRKCTCSECPQ